MARMANIIKSSAEYTDGFSGFRGIAPLGDHSEKSRLAYCENMFRSYESDSSGAIESVPGYRRLLSTEEAGGAINGMYFTPFGSLLHIGTGVYEAKLSERRTELTLTLLGTAENRRGTGFNFGGAFYLLDGKTVHRVGDSLDFSDPEPYVPTLFYNGVAYEKRNLLTDRFIEEYDVLDGRNYAMSSDGLRYSVTDEIELLCALSGADESVAGDISIPGYVYIGGVRHRVDEIASSAFAENTGITSVRIAEGVRRIGPTAFLGCSALKRVTTPESLTEIDNAAFNSCPSLTEIYLGKGLDYLGSSVFSASLNLSTVHYSGSEEELAGVEGIAQLSNVEKIYYSTDTSLDVSLALGCVPLTIERVTVGENEVDFSTYTDENGATRVKLSLKNHWQYNGMRVRIAGVLKPLFSAFDGTGDAGGVSGADAILGCTVSGIYDGRVFLSGNPLLPNTVFYSSRRRDGVASPLYFGEHSYFNDGVGRSVVSSILAIGDSLAIFKTEDDGVGSIFYHRAEATGDDMLPTVYPVTSIHSGLRIYGRAISFMDEAIFLTPSGLMAIEKQAINYERSVACRSTNVNAYLLAEDLTGAALAPFMGYIAICVGGRIYLGDPRATFIGARGNLEYEWFIVKGVGAHVGERAVYRYESLSEQQGLSVKEESIGEVFEGENVYSQVIGDRTVFFSREGKKAYALYKTREKRRDGLTPADGYFSDGKMLWFTAGGGLYAFNNDMRGIAPPSSTFEESEVGERIHPYYYSFDGVAPTYVLRTVRSYCSLPHLTKSTVKNSTVIKYRGVAPGEMICEVGTDRSGYTEAAQLYGMGLDFSEIDFSTLAISPPSDVSMPIGEKEKDWVEKDLTLYSRSFACPIAVYSINYRYKIKGRIKRR